MRDPIFATIESYERKSEEYIKNTKEITKFPNLHEMIEKFISNIPGKDVLDVGFGSGRDTFYLLDKGLHVEGIDLTDAFIENIKTKVDIPIYKMDMRELIFKDNSFSGIWCCASFLHLPKNDALKTLKGFFRVLKKRGILYFDVKQGSGVEWQNNHESNVTNADRYFSYYKDEEIIDLSEEAGFEIMLAKTQPHIKKNNNPWTSIMCRRS